MDAIQLFLLDHARVHAAALTGRAGGIALEDIAVRDLSEDQLRLRPHGLNSVAWILWHMARCEDVAVNVMVAARPQVLHEDDWPSRLRVSRRDIGTEMTSDQVDELSAKIDTVNLREYRMTVGRRTREIAQAMRPDDFETVVDLSRLADAKQQGAFGPGAEWVAKLWENRTKAWFLAWLAAGHNYMHLGHARWVRKLILAGVS